MENHDAVIESILDRNKRVEAEKAWEVSWTRRLFLALLTYATALLFLWFIEAPLPLLSALVPTGGYVLSTLSLPPLKRWWMRRGDVASSSGGGKRSNPRQEAE